MGVRTGDTTAYQRKKLRDNPPHVLITTPESLALLLSQASWDEAWRRVDTSSSTRSTPWSPRSEGPT